jgi:quinol monooxygenase YgiN
MVQLVLRMAVPSGRESALSRTLRAIMLPAQLNRDCVGAQLYVEVGNASAFYYVEEWLTEAHLIREIRSPRFSRLLEAMESAGKAPSLEFRFVQNTRGLEFVEAARSDPPSQGE